MPRYLSRWTLEELRQFAREHELEVMRNPRMNRVNKRSYYDALKRFIRRNSTTVLRKLSLAQLVERIRRENIPLPEAGSGRNGRLIKKDYEPEEELKF